MFRRSAKIRKKEVAVCIAAAWLILFGVVFAEGLGFYQDTPENLDQQIEQALASDIIIAGNQAPDFTSVAHLFIAAAVSPPTFGTLCADPRFPLDIGDRISCMTNDLKLYQLHSTYLI